MLADRIKFKPMMFNLFKHRVADYNENIVNDKHWFLYVVDHHEGPFTEEEIKILMRKGEVNKSNYIWKDGFADWMMMSEVPDFGSKDAKSDGHGPVAMVVEAKADAMSGDAVGEINGPDLSDVTQTASVWCLRASQQFSGPHSMKTIVRKLNASECSLEDAVWKEGWTSFIPLKNIPEFFQKISVDASKGAAKSRKKQSAFFGASGAKQKSSSGKIAKFVLVLLIIVGLYQGLATGLLNPILDKVGQRQLVQSLNLPAIQLPKSFLSNISLGPLDGLLSNLKTSALGLTRYLPESVLTYLVPTKLPDGLSAKDAETLKDVIKTELTRGARVATALLNNDVLMPSFAVATNLPKGVRYYVELRGRPETLVGTYRYEKKQMIEVQDGSAIAGPFEFMQQKALPRGEYDLIVYESSVQDPPVQTELNKLAKQPTPKLINSDRYTFVIDHYFLGGKKDAVYLNKLKAYQKGIEKRLNFEKTELKQLTMLLESLANESAAKFFELAQSKNQKRAIRDWKRYDAKYFRISSQVNKILMRVSAESKKSEYLFIDTYRDVFKVYKLTENLHQTQTQVFHKKATMDSVRKLAGQTASTLKNLKVTVAEMSK